MTIRAQDRSCAEDFYRTVLSALRIELTHVSAELIEWDDFSIIAADDDHPPTRHLHVGFVAPSPGAVDRFWEAGTSAGHPDDGRPGKRPLYGPTYYGAFLLDPDGNSAEAVHHEDVRRGGHIDHLWIGVRDLEESVSFYGAIARHTGLRPGRQWPEGGQQFRGAWATFSLMHDGRPPTESLHMAFPAPDQQAVHEFHAAATAAGYRDNGAPGMRPQYHPGYFSAYVLDPDGNNVESVFHGRR